MESEDIVTVSLDIGHAGSIEEVTAPVSNENNEKTDLDYDRQKRTFSDSTRQTCPRSRSKRSRRLQDKLKPNVMSGIEKRRNSLFSPIVALNCVICSANFIELVELESHVRSHDEVEHFTLVLRSQEKKSTDEVSDDLPKISSVGKDHQEPEKTKEENNIEEPKENLIKLSVHPNPEEQPTTDVIGTSDEKSDFTSKVESLKKQRRKKQISKLNYVLVKSNNRGRPSHKLICPECGEVIQSKLAMRLHMRTVHSKRGYNTKTTCDVCNDSFPSVKTLKHHLQEKHDLKMSAHNKIYKCPFCDEYFDRKSPLLLHKKKMHPGQTNYMCDDCGKKCQTPSELNTHRRMHTGERPYECNLCSVTFRFPNSLKEHMRLHTGERPFQCDVCGATFARQCNKRRHMISHTGKFIHSCEYCGKGFNDVGPLKIHVRMHTGERPFQCDMCEMKFVTKAQMQCHKAKHTRIRSHLCQVCGAAFLYSVDLRRHSKIHTGIRNHKCDECNAAFFRLDHLKRHQRSHASNSKRLANTRRNAKPAVQEESVLTTGTVDQQGALLTTALTADASNLNNESTLQHLCIVCSATYSSNEDLQNHMVVHMKQNSTALVIRDIQVVGSSGTNSDLTSTQHIYQQLPTEETNNYCVMCDVIALEPGGLKEHLQIVHQMQ